MQYLAILGRQPEISLAELRAQFQNVQKVSDTLATFESDSTPVLSRFGGSLKFARLLDVEPIKFLLSLPPGKITLGISDYSNAKDPKKAEKTALKLKRVLKQHDRSVRVIPNTSNIISTAAAHHNQLGEKPLHIELIHAENNWYTSLGAQNITAYAKRDQARPARDAKVGMLPPKLAQILINLCGPLKAGARILDPFCGTGVVLQEALLMGFTPYGTDLNDRMVKYSKRNLTWLGEEWLFKRRAEAAAEQERAVPVKTGDGDACAKKPSSPSQDAVARCSTSSVSQGDATTFTWQQPIDAVACETYLGPPMSNPPAEIKLRTVKQECGDIILKFLKNISTQIEPNTPLTLATPAWLREDGSYSSLDIIDKIEELGYNVSKDFGPSLLYARAGQVVAREILILRKK